MSERIAVTTLINRPVEEVWACWTTPEHITRWNAASDDWHCPQAELDLRVDGGFRYTMAARDGSASFDFPGTFTTVEPHVLLGYTIADGRKCEVAFLVEGGSTRVTETFDAENVHTPEQQRQGWQAILDRFKAYVETLHS